MKKFIYLYSLLISFASNAYTEENYHSTRNYHSLEALENSGDINFKPYGINDKNQVYGIYYKTVTLEETYNDYSIDSSSDSYVEAEDLVASRYLDSFQNFDEDHSDESLLEESDWSEEYVPLPRTYTKNVGGFFILDELNQMSLIQIPDEHLGEDLFSYNVFLNNSNQAVIQSIFYWYFYDQNYEIQKFSKTFNEINCLNDLGQILINNSMDKTAKILSNDGVSEINQDSELGKKLKKMIFFDSNHIELHQINNSGVILGEFKNDHYGSFFAWDGQLHLFHFIDSKRISKNSLNNQGVIMLSIPRDNRTVLWDKKDGYREITDFLGDKLNDSSTIVGNITIKGHFPWEDKLVPAVWQEGEIIMFSDLLGQDFSNIEIVDINNNGQILFSYKEEGKKSFCVMNF